LFAGCVIDYSGDQAVGGRRDLTARQEGRDVDAIDEAPENCNDRRALGISVA